MFTEGILSFNDAYDLAFRYIQEKSLNFSSFSDKRFKYLFVDEIQDCDNQQVEFIKKIFADNKVIVQRLEITASQSLKGKRMTELRMRN